MSLFIGFNENGFEDGLVSTSKVVGIDTEKPKQALKQVGKSMEWVIR